MLGEEVDLSRGNFQLPLLLDQHEQMLAAPSACSTLLVGRSGTGKTSIALDILYSTQEANIKRRHQRRSGASSGVAPHVNTLFLCKSRTLVSRVQGHLEQLMLPLGERRAEPDAVKEAFTMAKEELPSPLFLSSSEWLVLLDRCTIKRWFLSEKEEAEFVSTSNGTIDGLATLQAELLDGEATTIGGGAGGGGGGEAPLDLARLPKRGKAASPGLQKRSLITFELFAVLMGKHSALRSLSASSVYREIFSYIKGSREAMQTSSGYLTRDQYVQMASKLSPLPPEKRPEVYDAFEEYLKKKRKHNLYDLCDVVFHLYTNAKQRTHSPIDKIVLDEVQDLTMAELALLYEVCTSAGHT